MRINFEYVTNLEYEVKALRAKVKAYESSEAYRRQQQEYEKRLREKDHAIAALKKELAEAHLETATVRNSSRPHFMPPYLNLKRKRGRTANSQPR